MGCTKSRSTLFTSPLNPGTGLPQIKPIGTIPKCCVLPVVVIKNMCEVNLIKADLSGPQHQNHGDAAKEPSPNVNRTIPNDQQEHLLSSRELFVTTEQAQE
jgi:hypothetical protein